MHLDLGDLTKKYNAKYIIIISCWLHEMLTFGTYLLKNNYN